MKKLFKWLRRPRMINPRFNLNCEVLVIDDRATKIHEALGVSADRVSELIKLSADALRSSKDVASAICEMSLRCKHPNELALSVWAMGRVELDSYYMAHPLFRIVHSQMSNP